MDVKDVLHAPTWDRERLGDLGQVLLDHGGRLSKDVIGEICPAIADYSSSVSNLILYLYRRRAISDDDFFKLKEPSATGNHLCFSLVALSQKTHGEGKHIIRNLYLALLDAFLHMGDKWCHFVAFRLRQIAVQHLQRLTEPPVHIEPEKTDLRSVVSRIPHIKLQSPATSQLRRLLGTPSCGVEITHLREILEEYLGRFLHCPQLDDWLVPVVRAMMLTTGVGRYVSLLLPFYRSYPVEVLIFLEQLGEKWEDFALFLGFTGQDLRELKDRSGGNTMQEIRHFSKVWRMPDMKQEQNNNILHRVLNKARISFEMAVAESSPQSGVNQLMQPSPKGFRTVGVVGVVTLLASDDGTTFATQFSNSTVDSPMSKRGSLGRSSIASGHPRHIGYLKSMQSGSSDLGMSSLDSEPPLQQNGDQSEVNDVDTASEISSAPYLRIPSYIGEDMVSSATSPLPTSLPQYHQEPKCFQGLTSPVPGSMTSCSSQSRPTSLKVCPISEETNTRSEEIVAPPSLSSAHNEHRPPGESESLGFAADQQVTPPTESLGMGLYGEVWGLEHRGRAYMAKKYRSSSLTHEELKEEFERKILGLSHRNVVKYYGVWRLRGGDESVVIMERFQRNLETVCIGKGGKRTELQPETKLSILGQVADGLGYLHSKDIVHSDLIPTNILLSSPPEFRAKITDHGNSVVQPISEACIKGPIEDSKLHDYLPQEAIDGEEMMYEVDVFSFGHLSLYVILQRQPHPLKKYTERIKGTLIARTEVDRREDYFNEMSVEIKDSELLKPLLEWTKMCLADEASERPRITKFRIFCPSRTT